MTNLLTTTQVRILGTLIEKQLSTPEYYPLTRNALIAGCNQKSNREPVMSLSETAVAEALAVLCACDLAREVHDPSGRVARFAHRVNAVLGVDGLQAAILCELMLRGPQTAGEIRNRGTRLARFESVEQIEGVLQELAGHETPLTVLLPRQPGARERRWAHLLAGEPVVEQTAMDPSFPCESASTGDAAARLTALEAEVADLRQQLSELAAAFADFKSKFE